MCNIFSVDIFFYHFVNNINDSEEEEEAEISQTQ